MNVDAMLRSLTLEQFLELEAWYGMQPRGDARHDLHEARALHQFFNLNVRKEDRLPLEDFMLKFEDQQEEKKPQSNEDKLWILRLMAQGLGSIKVN